MIKKLDDVNFIFLGSEISSLNSNVVSPGWVSDTDEYFYASDLLVNPVIAGSGIKTKNLDALFHGIPVLTTKVGAEGIEDLIGNGLNICDLGNFAEEIVNIKKNIDFHKKSINLNILKKWNIESFKNSVRKLIDYIENC